MSRTRRHLSRRLRRQGPVILLVIAFMLVAFAYSAINPLHEATDELRHYRFVRTIVETGRLPVQGEEACRSQSHHPPLIYLLGAAATFWIDTGRDVCQSPPTNPFWGYRYAEVGTDNKNLYLHGPDESFPWYGEALAAHIVRGINVLIGAGVVLLTWATGRAIWPEKPALALGGAAFVAFNPMVLYMSGAINNDVIAALSGAAVLYGCVRLLRDPAGLSWRWGVVLGALYGLALMSKFNMAAILLLIGVAVTWTAGQKKQWRQWWQANIALVITAALLAGWWFVRNQALYGEPTGFQILTELWGARDPVESLPVAISELPYLWTTLWGRFGFGQIPLPEGVYNGLRGLVAFGLLGVLLPLVRRDLRTTPFVYLFLLALTVLLNFSVVFNYMLVSPAGAMGRFFFPGLPALSLLIFYGFYLWGRLVLPGGERRWLPVLAGGANLAMLALALIALFGYVAPAYARPDSFAVADVPHPVNAQFDALVNLRGYALNATEIRPGEVLAVDLYWEVTARPPGDFLLFVHLLDENGLMVAQRDTHPGLGKFPSSQWRPGDRFHETIRLPIPETAYSPNTATLSVGLYAPTYRLGITGPDGAGWGDALPLETIAIQPLAGDTPNAQTQNFNNEIMLTGYAYDRRVLRPGETLNVTLYWAALRDNLPDYRVQVHLMDPQNPAEPLSRADTRPQDGTSPTNTWTAGQQVIDNHLLPIPSDLPAGPYEIHIALLNVETNQRQNIVAEDGHWINNRLLLAPVLVQP